MVARAFLVRGLLEAGAEVSRMSGAQDIEVGVPAALRDAFRAAWTTHAAYVNFGRAASGVPIPGGCLSYASVAGFPMRGREA